MSVTSGYSPEHGPYTIADLDALPEEGKRYELVHGHLIEMSPSVLHDEVAEAVKEALRPGLPAGYLLRGPYDLRMPDGSLYSPDVAILDAAAVRRAKDEDRRALTGEDALLVVEVQRPSSGSWKKVHHEKVRDYAAAGVPHYWIVDLEDVPSITVYHLDEGDITYTLTHHVTGDRALTTEAPFPIALTPADLLA
ncbi:Uma2 family endonuclease [Actinomadura flavalba]|uniref:Uma2 family endonuclease n=1 Tax=Actinomadura flavalba TaxID=1120938 RepID=UPI000361F4E9|nr:Uma2 family endonuclease [Actinomadura flavalba]